MPKKSRSSNYKRSKKQSYKKRSHNRRQQGGKIVLPMRYFNENYNNHYDESQPVYRGAVSYGVPHQQVLATGPNLHPGYAMKQQGGGVMPAEFYGNNSGRYFEAGAPELDTCTSAYGVIHPTSHGVVLSGENAGFMGPNLAPFPNFQDMTGGSKKRKVRKGKKTKKAKKARKFRKVKKTKKFRKSRK